MTTEKKPADLIQENAVLLALSLSRPGMTRTVGRGDVADKREVVEFAAGAPVEVDADVSTVRVAKRILDSPQLKAVSSLDFATRMRLKSQCLPSRFIHAGMYWLPVSMAEDVLARLEQFIEDRGALVEAFLAAYPAQAKAASACLRGLYRAEEYPSVAALRLAFSAQYEVFTLNTAPNVLASAVSSAAMRKAGARAEAMWAETAREVNEALASSLAELVDGLAARLEGGKRLRKDAEKKVEAFLDALPQRNIASSAELRAVAVKARAVLSGVEVARDNEQARAAVAKSLRDVGTLLAGMTERRPTRFIEALEEGGD